MGGAPLQQVGAQLGLGSSMWICQCQQATERYGPPLDPFPTMPVGKQPSFCLRTPLKLDWTIRPLLSSV